jgi:hypothetical protein
MKFNDDSTERGFSTSTFRDYYDQGCSMQESSLCSPRCLWLGVDDTNPQILASNAEKYGIKTNKTVGWIPYPVPPDVLISSRMHLDEDSVKDLIKKMQEWVDSE